MKTKFQIVCILIASMLSMHSFAQRTTDLENCKDYPSISRFKGAIIEFCKETKWGAYKMPVNEKGLIDWENPQALEGKVIRIQYSTSVDNNSEFVLQNYKSAFKKAGFTILIALVNEELGFSERPHTWTAKYYDAGGYYNGLNNAKFGLGRSFPAWKNDHCYIAAKCKKDGKEIYAVVYAFVDENYTLITQDMIEVEAVETGMVSAEMISEGINSGGRAVLDGLVFENDKYEILPESEEALKNIADYINKNPGKKFFIVGHTDNVGNFESNSTLAKNRANAVVAALVTKHAVKADQLTAYGVSCLSPVASNATAEGKARNRRVEIVEQ